MKRNLFLSFFIPQLPSELTVVFIRLRQPHLLQLVAGSCHLRHLCISTLVEVFQVLPRKDPP